MFICLHDGTLCFRSFSYLRVPIFALTHNNNHRFMAIKHVNLQ